MEGDSFSSVSELPMEDRIAYSPRNSTVSSISELRETIPGVQMDDVLSPNSSEDDRIVQQIRVSSKSTDVALDTDNIPSQISKQSTSESYSSELINLRSSESPFSHSIGPSESVTESPQRIITDNNITLRHSNGNTKGEDMLNPLVETPEYNSGTSTTIACVSMAMLRLNEIPNGNYYCDITINDVSRKTEINSSVNWLTEEDALRFNIQKEGCDVPVTVVVYNGQKKMWKSSMSQTIEISSTNNTIAIPMTGVSSELSTELLIRVCCVDVKEFHNKALQHRSPDQSYFHLTFVSLNNVDNDSDFELRMSIPKVINKNNSISLKSSEFTTQQIRLKNKIEDCNLQLWNKDTMIATRWIEVGVSIKDTVGKCTSYELNWIRSSEQPLPVINIIWSLSSNGELVEKIVSKVAKSIPIRPFVYNIILLRPTVDECTTLSNKPIVLNTELRLSVEGQLLSTSGPITINQQSNSLTPHYICFSGTCSGGHDVILDVVVDRKVAVSIPIGDDFLQSHKTPTWIELFPSKGSNPGMSAQLYFYNISDNDDVKITKSKTLRIERCHCTKNINVAGYEMCHSPAASISVEVYQRSSSGIIETGYDNAVTVTDQVCFTSSPIFMWEYNFENNQQNLILKLVINNETVAWREIFCETGTVDEMMELDWWSENNENFIGTVQCSYFQSVTSNDDIPISENGLFIDVIEIMNISGIPSNVIRPMLFIYAVSELSMELCYQEELLILSDGTFNMLKLAFSSEMKNQKYMMQLTDDATCVSLGMTSFYSGLSIFDVKKFFKPRKLRDGHWNTEDLNYINKYGNGVVPSVRFKSFQEKDVKVDNKIVILPNKRHQNISHDISKYLLIDGAVIRLNQEFNSPLRITITQLPVVIDDNDSDNTRIVSFCQSHLLNTPCSIPSFKVYLTSERTTTLQITIKNKLTDVVLSTSKIVISHCLLESSSDGEAILFCDVPVKMILNWRIKSTATGSCQIQITDWNTDDKKILKNPVLKIGVVSDSPESSYYKRWVTTPPNKWRDVNHDEQSFNILCFDSISSSVSSNLVFYDFETRPELWMSLWNGQELLGIQRSVDFIHISMIEKNSQIKFSSNNSKPSTCSLAINMDNGCQSLSNYRFRNITDRRLSKVASAIKLMHNNIHRETLIVDGGTGIGPGKTQLLAIVKFKISDNRLKKIGISNSKAPNIQGYIEIDGGSYQLQQQTHCLENLTIIMYKEMTLDIKGNEISLVISTDTDIVIDTVGVWCEIQNHDQSDKSTELNMYLNVVKGINFDKHTFDMSLSSLSINLIQSVDGKESIIGSTRIIKESPDPAWQCLFLCSCIPDIGSNKSISLSNFQLELCNSETVIGRSAMLSSLQKSLVNSKTSSPSLLMHRSEALIDIYQSPSAVIQGSSAVGGVLGSVLVDCNFSFPKIGAEHNGCVSSHVSDIAREFIDPSIVFQCVLHSELVQSNNPSETTTTNTSSTSHAVTVSLPHRSGGKDRIITIGGSTKNGVFNTSVSELDLSTDTCKDLALVSENGQKSIFDGRIFHTAIAINGAIVVHGGYGPGGYFCGENPVLRGKRKQKQSQAINHNSKTVTKIYEPRPPHQTDTRSDHSLDHNKNRMHNSQCGYFLNTIIVNISPTSNNFTSWEVQTTQSSAETYRADHTAIHCGSKMLVFGGFELLERRVTLPGRPSLSHVLEKRRNDIAYLDFVSNKWKRIKPTGGVIPEALSGHGAVKYGKKMWIFGGTIDALPDNTETDHNNNNNNMNREQTTENLIYESSDEELLSSDDTQRAGFLSPRTRRRQRRSSQSKLNSNHIEHGVRYVNSLYSFDLSTKSWEVVTPRGDIPLPREHHSTSLFDNQMFIYGGKTTGRYLNSCFRLVFDLAESSSSGFWRKVSFFECVPPAPRINPTTVMCLPKMKQGVGKIRSQPRLVLMGGTEPSSTSFHSETKGSFSVPTSGYTCCISSLVFTTSSNNLERFLVSSKTRECVFFVFPLSLFQN